MVSSRPFPGSDGRPPQSTLSRNHRPGLAELPSSRHSSPTTLSVPSKVDDDEGSQHMNEARTARRRAAALAVGATAALVLTACGGGGGTTGGGGGGGGGGEKPIVGL